MAHYDTRLSGAGYRVQRAFWFIWRWRTLERLGGATGLSIGRKAAMSAARSTLRDRKPPASDFSLATRSRAEPANFAEPPVEEARRPARWPTRAERLHQAPLSASASQEHPPFTH